ncbi:MAG: aminotransferase class I/II-fold pyridoxal phosphate-dependent enzyme [Woeseiaceae bacterium]|nr:aminotransferase class I/II-fold pyridoxal phosphate-dependent enzyme [Woeseiaceae bacterium]
MFQPFALENYLSDHEQNVDFNFSESGVHPLTLGELLELAGRSPAALGDTLLDYPEVRGKRALRERIAALYPGADADNVLVTVGASEANHLVAATLLEPGDRVVVMQPGYRQLSGNALNAGFDVAPVPLVEAQDWALDTDALAAAIDDRTRLVSVINPNNPTGHVLTPDERRAVIAAADRVGAWIVADEVYAGTERGGREPTPSFWGDYGRVIAINSMSKAYGLPGLRLGWLVAPAEVVAPLWRRHEYATISASMLGNELAAIALDAEVRPKLTARARRLIDRGFDVLMRELGRREGVYAVVPPQASAMCVVRFDLPVGSREFVDRLVAEYRTLVVPGDCFGLSQHFRFSSALAEDYLIEGIARINALAETYLRR